MKLKPEENISHLFYTFNIKISGVFCCVHECKGNVTPETNQVKANVALQSYKEKQAENNKKTCFSKNKGRVKGRNSYRIVTYFSFSSVTLAPTELS